MSTIISVSTTVLLLVGLFMSILVFTVVASLVVLSVLGSIYRLVNKVNKYKITPKKK